MNIIYLHTSLKKCGPTSQLLTLLSANSKEHNLYVFFIKPNKSFRDSIENAKILRSIFSLIKLIFKINKEKYIIHSSGIIPDILNAFIFFLMPNNLVSFSTIRNIPWEDYTLKFGFIGNLLSSFHLMILRKLNIIFCSYDLYNKFLNSKFKFTKINYVDNCCTLKSKSDYSSLIKKRLILNNDRLKLLSLSPIINRKQILETVKLFKSIDLDFQFDIYGSGDKLEDLLKVIKSDKRFKYKGFVSNNKINFNSYDSLVSLSLSEGLPNSVIESLYNGLYVILSPISAHKYLSNFSSKVIILDRFYQDNILLKLSFILENRNNIKDIDKVREYFGRERMLQEYYDLYCQ